MTLLAPSQPHPADPNRPWPNPSTPPQMAEPWPRPEPSNPTPYPPPTPRIAATSGRTA